MDFVEYIRGLELAARAYEESLEPEPQTEIVFLRAQELMNAEDLLLNVMVHVGFLPVVHRTSLQRSFFQRLLRHSINLLQIVQQQGETRHLGSNRSSVNVEAALQLEQLLLGRAATHPRTHKNEEGQQNRRQRAHECDQGGHNVCLADVAVAAFGLLARVPPHGECDGRSRWMR